MGDKFGFPPLIRKLKRGPQVILPKDFGLIVAFSGVGKDSFVVDIGTGSGFLAIAMANIAARVVTYEWKHEFAELARKNIERSGLTNIELKEKNAFEGIEETNADLMTIDIANAERVVPIAKNCIKDGGCIAAFLPNVEQLKEFVLACESENFSEVFAVECIIREMLVRKFGVRPATKGITHTGYLAFARK